MGFDQGILELVKNSYDADARRCVVELLEVGQPGGTIKVSDDGAGMNGDQIINGWLILGESRKSTTKLTKGGRYPAGNKGLGRLAALRMGNCADLKTVADDSPDIQYQVRIDWDRFDEAQSVEDVDLDVTQEKTSDRSASGTEITIIGLRDRLTRVEVKRLARGMLLLADPFKENPGGFQPILRAESFQDLEQLVERRYFKESEFHLRAEVTGNGEASAVVIDYSGKILYQASHGALRPKQNTVAYKLPSLQFDLWVFIINQQTFATRTTSLGAVREWLSEFGGVHLYLNGIRVSPYGNQGDDWLNLNLARVQHPEFRPGTNTSIGRIAIDDGGQYFVQKTDRSGIIENEAFLELKAFTKDALDWMARERLREAEYRRANNRVESTEKVRRERETVVATLKALPTPQQIVIQESFQRYDQARESEASALRKDVLLYRTLGTVGIVAAVFAHEFNRPLDLIIRNARLVERIARELLKDEYEHSALKEPTELIFAQAALMEGFQDLTLGFVEQDKRRNRRVDVYTVIKSVIKSFKPILDERHVKVSTQLRPGKPYLRGSAAALEAVLANFMVNSLRAFQERQVGNRQIVITAEFADKRLVIRFMDNGPGIESLGIKDIWSPGESGYERGTGLGLTIVRDTIRDLGGTVDALAHGELKGAEFIVSIPLLGF